MLDSNHIPSCTSAGRVLQLCKVSQNSNEPFRTSWKEYGCCLKFKRGDNSTYTFKKKAGACTSQAQLLLNCFLNFYETLQNCSIQPTDVHEGIPLLSKI
jgi:hypothetical protein